MHSCRFGAVCPSWVTLCWSWSWSVLELDYSVLELVSRSTKRKRIVFLGQYSNLVWNCSGLSSYSMRNVCTSCKRTSQHQHNNHYELVQECYTLQHQALVHDTTNKHVHDCTQFLTFASTSCISCSAYFLPRQRRGPNPNGAAAKLCLMLARSGESRSQRSGRNASGSSKNSARRDATP